MARHGRHVRCPNAIGLMYAEAVIELAALITIVLTPASIRAAILARNPDYTTAQ
jgi:hypothetical protein